MTKQATESFPVASGLIDHLFKKVNDVQVNKRIRKQAIPKNATTALDLAHVTAHFRGIAADKCQDNKKLN